MKGDRNYLLIFLMSALLFIPFLGKVHLFDWDEINFAEAAREMIVTNDYSQVQIDFKPFWEKPPLFIWVQVASMKIFGVNEFAARLPNAIVGILTLLVIYSIAKKIFDKRMGVLWVMTFGCTILPHLYFKSGIIDPMFNLFIFLGIYFFIEFLYHKENDKEKKSLKWISASALFIGLAILTKGPVAFLICALCFIVFAIVKRKLFRFYWKEYLYLLLLISIISSFWIGLVWYSSGKETLVEFFLYQWRLLFANEAGHKEFLFYHWVVLLIGCFPASLLLFYGFSKKQDHYLNSRQLLFKWWMKDLFWVVLILFTIVQTKIIHYSSLCWFPLTFLAAYVLWIYTMEKRKLHSGWIIMLMFIGISIGTAVTLIPFFGIHIHLLKSYISNPMTLGNLDADVSWNYAECLIGLFFIGGLFYGLYFLLKKDLLSGFFILFASSVFLVQMVLVDFAPKLEKYAQGTPIEFYESMQGKDVYIGLGFQKSYAHLFYAKKLPPANRNSLVKNWMENGPIDKPAYFVVRKGEEENFMGGTDIKIGWNKNGFVFLRREAVIK